MSVWLAHAVLGFLAWGLLAPLAGFVSSFRVVLFPDTTTTPRWDRRRDPDEMRGRKWVKSHRYMSEASMLATWILFGLAVAGVKKGHHFKKPHQIVGLVVFLSTFPLWGLGRVLMPPKKPKNADNTLPSSENTSLLVQQEMNESNQVQSLQTKEIILVWVHRLFGAAVSIAGLWEICSGILLYNKRANSGNSLQYAYLYWCGFLVLVLSILFGISLKQR